MTKKLSSEQKKFNKLLNALNNTWNCDYGCTKCPFRQEDNIVATRETTHLCGAILIREYAIKIFERRNNEVGKLLD